MPRRSGSKLSKPPSDTPLRASRKPSGWPDVPPPPKNEPPQQARSDQQRASSTRATRPESGQDQWKITSLIAALVVAGSVWLILGDIIQYLPLGTDGAVNGARAGVSLIAGVLFFLYMLRRNPDSAASRAFRGGVVMVISALIFTLGVPGALNVFDYTLGWSTPDPWVLATLVALCILLFLAQRK